MSGRAARAVAQRLGTGASAALNFVGPSELAAADGLPAFFALPAAGVEVVVGREVGAGGLTLDSERQPRMISRQHARMVIDDDGSCKVRDLGSTNGLLVNNVRVEEAVLCHGDVIAFGGARGIPAGGQIDPKALQSIYQYAYSVCTPSDETQGSQQGAGALCKRRTEAQSRDAATAGDAASEAPKHAERQLRKRKANDDIALSAAKGAAGKPSCAKDGKGASSGAGTGKGKARVGEPEAPARGKRGSGRGSRTHAVGQGSASGVGGVGGGKGKGEADEPAQIAKAQKKLGRKGKADEKVPAASGQSCAACGKPRKGGKKADLCQCAECEECYARWPEDKFSVKECSRCLGCVVERISAKKKPKREYRVYENTRMLCHEGCCACVACPSCQTRWPTKVSPHVRSSRDLYEDNICRDNECTSCWKDEMDIMIGDNMSGSEFEYGSEE